MLLRGLPHAYRAVAAPVGTTRVRLTVTSAGGGTWEIARGASGWLLQAPAAAAPAAGITMNPTTAWQVFTKALRPSEAWARVEVIGEEAVARPAFGLVAVMG